MRPGDAQVCLAQLVHQVGDQAWTAVAEQHRPHPQLFIDATPAEALRVASEAAGGLDVRLGGGPSTVRDFLAADLIDHMHLAVVPVVLDSGVRLWDGLAGIEERFDIESVSSPSGVVHLTFTRRARR